MNKRLQQFLNMTFKAERRILSQKVIKSGMNLCAPPSNRNTSNAHYRSERIFLCFLKKGSLTVEASLILPFFLSVLLALFTFFGRYELSTELGMKAAGEAKKLAVIMSNAKERETADITIFKSERTPAFRSFPFDAEMTVKQIAVCRAWIGFTELENQEVFVYITPNGSVYHLSSNCTHLRLSVKAVTMNQALKIKNNHGEKYRSCSLCIDLPGLLVYVTEEGECYHTERSCSGLKRTIRLVPISQVEQRECCMRCMERGNQ